jgi:hypothetical protein
MDDFLAARFGSCPVDLPIRVGRPVRTLWVPQSADKGTFAQIVRFSPELGVG